MKKYKVERYYGWLQLVGRGIAVDYSEVNFQLPILNAHVTSEIFKYVANGFGLSGYGGITTYIEGEAVHGSVDGAIENFNYALGHLPDDKKQQLAEKVVYDVAMELLRDEKVAKDALDDKSNEDYYAVFDTIMKNISPHLKGRKISLDYVLDELIKAAIDKKGFKEVVGKGDEEIFKYLETIYPNLRSNLEHLKSKHKDLFEVTENLIEQMPLYARLSFKKNEYLYINYDDDKKKKTPETKEKESQELRELVLAFNKRGYPFSINLINNLIGMYDPEINKICKKHWDNYKGLEDKYKAFDVIIDSTLSSTSWPNETTEKATENLRRKEIVRDFLNSFTAEDIKNILKSRESYENTGFILLLNSEKIEEIAKNIKIPIIADMERGYYVSMYAIDQELAIKNFETLLDNNAFTGGFSYQSGVGLVSKYVTNLIAKWEDNNDRPKAEERFKKLMQDYSLDIDYIIKRDSKMHKLDKFPEPFKKIINEAKIERESNKKLATELADELTKKVIDGKFAGKEVRKMMKAAIEKSLFDLSQDKDTKPIFKEMMNNKDKRLEIIDKFSKTIDKEVINKAKDTKGLLSAIIERLFNIIGMVFGQENLGYLMKGRVTGFEMKDGFVDKLRNELKPQGEGRAMK